MSANMPTARLFKTPYMQYPDWLFKDGHLSKEFFKDRNEAQQEYILFFTLMNVACQKEIFDRLIDRLNESQNAYNPYDYSKNGLEYAKSYILHQVNLWMESFDPLFRNLDQGIFSDFMTIEVKEGTGIHIAPNVSAADMFNGKLQADFLINHPGTELQFHRFIMKKMIYKGTQAPESK